MKRLHPRDVKRMVAEMEEAALQSTEAHDQFCAEHDQPVKIVVPSGVLTNNGYLQAAANLEHVHYDVGQVPPGLKTQGLEGYWQGRCVLWLALRVANFEGEYRIAIFYL